MHPKTFTVMLLLTFVTHTAPSPDTTSQVECHFFRHHPISEGFICTKLKQDFILVAQSFRNVHFDDFILIVSIYRAPQTFHLMYQIVSLLVIYVLLTISFLSFFRGHFL